MSVINSYLPPRDQDLDAWALNFDLQITAAPTDYGLVAGDATAYHTLRLAFTTALAVALATPTRTKTTVAAKNSARFDLIASSKMLAAQVQAFPAITPELLSTLGLTVRDTTPSPIAAPSSAPIISPINSSGGGIFFRFADEVTPDSRAKAPGAIGLDLYAKVGTTPPATIADCVYMGTYTKNTTGPGSRGVRVDFGGGNVGKTAYLIGQWKTRRGLVGPVSATASMTIAA